MKVTKDYYLFNIYNIKSLLVFGQGKDFVVILL